MDPILQVVHYLFKKKNKAISDENIDSFFDNGISFPQFIAIIFDIEKIPKVNPDPKTIFHSETNNYLALQYLLQNNTEIAKFNPKYTSSRDRYNLLALILSKQCFNVNLKDTIDKCNIITKSLDISFHTKKDIVNKNCILTLLNVLTEGKVPIENNTDNFDQLMSKCFDIAKVPLVINETSLQMQNQFIFIIQLEIIFDFFSDKINQLNEISIEKEKIILNKSNSNLLNTESESVKPNVLKNSTEPLNDDKKLISDKQETCGNVLESNEVIDQKKNTIKIKILLSYTDNYNLLIKQLKIEPYLLKTINIIGSNINLHFDYFFQTIENCNLLKLVKHLIKKQEDQIFIENIINNKNISNSEKNNSIIRFLCQIDPKFEVLSLDFKDPVFQEPSIIIFYQNLLDSFFIKKTKKELFERFYTILHGRSRRFSKCYLEKETLSEWYSYLSLINFVESGEVVLDEKFLISKSTEIITKTKIPIILDDNFFEERLYSDFNLIYYQLQFIFDELDRSTSRYVEFFLIALNKFCQIKMPPIDQILASVRSKNISLALQIKRNKENAIKKRNQKDENNAITCSNESIQLPIDPPLTFTDRQKESSKSSHNQNETQESIKFENSRSYWNPDDSSFIYEGIMIDQKKHDSSSNHHLNEFWNGVISAYSAKVKRKKLIDTSTLQKPCFELANLSKNKKSSLYKFFYFDEKSQKWRYNNDAIDQFAKDNNLNLKESFKIPLILLFNSYEQDIITLCSKIILNQYPNLDESENEIFIYGLMGLPLSMMNFNFDSNPNLMEITPLFLILHVPTSKQSIPNLKTILYQIYSFLYVICDIRIIISTNIYYSDQVNMDYEIKEINKNFTFFEKDYHDEDNARKVDDFEDEDEEDKFERTDDDDENDRLLNLFDTTFCKKSLEVITLYNNKDFRYTEKIIKPEERFFFFTCFININDPYTYRHFLDTLNKLICKSKSIGNFQDIKNSFQFLPLFGMSTFYISLSRRSENVLLDKIKNRYNEIRQKYNGQLNGFHIISNLQKEILETFPLIDREYSLMCNNVLNQLSRKINQENIEIFKSELEISSKNNLKYLEQLIKHEVYWTDEQIDNLKNGHYYFLNQEFFSIIKYFYAPEKIPNVYTDNKNILLDQTKKDFKKIESFLSEFKKKLELKNKEVPDEMEQETNYTIRERENEREIKVRVEINDDIENLIPSDY